MFSSFRAISASCSNNSVNEEIIKGERLAPRCFKGVAVKFAIVTGRPFFRSAIALEFSAP